MASSNHLDLAEPSSDAGERPGTDGPQSRTDRPSPPLRDRVGASVRGVRATGIARALASRTTRTTRQAGRLVGRRLHRVNSRLGDEVSKRVGERVRRTVAVRVRGWDTLEVAAGPLGLLPPTVRAAAGGVDTRGVRRFRLNDPAADYPVHIDQLRVDVPDPASYERFASSQLLRGKVDRIRVRIERAPAWLRAGLELPRTSKEQTELSWRVCGDGVQVELGWRTRRPIAQALAEVRTALLRPGPPDGGWDQVGGPIKATDRSTFCAQPLPIGTAIANPFGRRLIGHARRLTLALEGERVVVRDADGTDYLCFDPTVPIERTLLAHRWDRYAVLSITDLVPTGAFTEHVLLALAACGVVVATRSPVLRDRLSALGVTAVVDASEVKDLAGYQLSTAASRRGALAADPALRETALAAAYALPTAADEAALPAGAAGNTGTVGGPHRKLPGVSALVASKRPEDIDACLAYLGAQSYPRLEVVLGTHGYELSADRRTALAERLGVPLRVVAINAESTLGEVLGTLSRRAEGELLTKVDDDDHYGPDHVADLFLAWRATGADLVAKSARFVHLAGDPADSAGRGETLDRRWAAHEAFEVSPAGGTMLLARSTLAHVGGWSTAPRHVDAELLDRVRAAGGVSYRTHGLGYVYVRRASGHTWHADRAALAGPDDVSYDGLPHHLLALDTPPATTTTTAPTAASTTASTTDDASTTGRP